MTLEEAKKAIANKSIIDYHFLNETPKNWKWIRVVSLSDDNTGIYYKKNGHSLTSLFSKLEDIVVIKIG